MNDQEPQWPTRQPPQPQTWSPSNQGWPPPQPANMPPRQFKNPLSLPLPYGQQQDGQAQWSQQSPQLKGQPKQPQWPPLLQLPVHPHSSLPQPPSRRSRRGLWLILGIVALVVLVASFGVSSLASRVNTASHTATTSLATATPSQVRQSTKPTQQAATQPASLPTAIPTQAHTPGWTTTHTFTGSAEKKTDSFTVGDTWKIIWTCNPGTIFGGLGIMIVNVFSSDGTFQHGAINDTCKAGHTTGNAIQHQGSSIYLDITGGGNWTIQVQELR